MAVLPSLIISFHGRTFSTAPAWAVPWQQLRSYILGRLSRAGELNLEGHELLRFGLRLVDELAVCGWTLKDFDKVARSTAGMAHTIQLISYQALVRELRQLTRD